MRCRERSSLEEEEDVSKELHDAEEHVSPDVEEEEDPASACSSRATHWPNLAIRTSMWFAFAS